MLARTRKLLVGAGMLVVICIGSIVWGLFFADRTPELNRSLEVLLRERLKLVDARVTQASFHNEVDAAGFWSVTVNSSSEQLEKNMRDVGFQRSGEADSKYFSEDIRRELNSDDLSAYHVAEAHLVLGNGTICDKLECNVAIVWQTGRPTVFVMIWKI